MSSHSVWSCLGSHQHRFRHLRPNSGSGEGGSHSCLYPAHLLSSSSRQRASYLGSRQYRWWECVGANISQMVVSLGSYLFISFLRRWSEIQGQRHWAWSDRAAALTAVCSWPVYVYCKYLCHYRYMSLRTVWWVVAHKWFGEKSEVRINFSSILNCWPSLLNMDPCHYTSFKSPVVIEVCLPSWL